MLLYMFRNIIPNLSKRPQSREAVENDHVSHSGTSKLSSHALSPSASSRDNLLGRKRCLDQQSESVLLQLYSLG